MQHDEIPGKYCFVNWAKCARRVRKILSFDHRSALWWAIGGRSSVGAVWRLVNLVITGIETAKATQVIGRSILILCVTFIEKAEAWSYPQGLTRGAGLVDVDGAGMLIWSTSASSLNRS